MPMVEVVLFHQILKHNTIILMEPHLVLHLRQALMDLQKQDIHLANGQTIQQAVLK